MKKSAVILSGVLAVAVLGGGAYFLSNSGVDTSAYWDGKAALNQAGGADSSLPLLRAVRAKDAAAVAYFIGKGADVDAKDGNGVSAVIQALEAGDVALFEQLAALSKADFKQPQYLEKAIAGGNAAMVKAVLGRGADANVILSFKGRKRPDDVLDYTDPRVMTPLKKAVAEQKAEVAEVLLDHGAEGVVYFLSEEVQKTTPEMVKVLAKKAGNLRQIVIKGMDLLAYAASEAAPETLRFLLAENAGDVNKAMLRVLMYRKKNNHYEEALDMFLEAGAAPTAEVLELILKQKNPEVFAKTAACLAQPNVQLRAGNEHLLMYAIRTGDIETVRFLLDKGVDIWAEEPDGATPLKTVISLGDARLDMRQLFESRIKSADETGYNGETLLMLYAGNGEFDTFEKNIANGGDIWQKDNANKTVLMYAAEGGNTKILDYLLYKGDNPNAVDKQGRTALMYAAAAGKAQVIKYLADRGADIMLADNDGKSAIMYAAENGHADVVNMLINLGESAATNDKHGRSVLMYAALGGNADVVETLLMKGVDVNHVDDNRMSVLSYAVKGGNAQFTKLLLDKGANPYEADRNGYTPAILALQQGNERLYDLTADFRVASVTKTLDNGKNLLMYAVEGGNVELMSKIFKTGIQLLNEKDHEGRTAMMLLAGKGRPEVVRQALEAHGDVSVADKNGKTVLMYAAENSVGVTLINILKRVRKFDINRQDNEGRSALMYAVGAENNQPVKMHMLLANGEDAELADKEGKTVLMYAVGNPYNRVDANATAELLNKIRKVDAKDNAGRTALMYAAANMQADGSVIDVLLRQGASVNEVDKNGKTVLMYAVESGDISKVRMLLAKGASTDGKTIDGKTVGDFVNQDMLCFKSAVEKLL